jgi:Flp pilus assembly protein TadD
MGWCQTGAANKQVCLMISLKKSRETGKLAEFIAQHESDAPGDQEAFSATLKAMAGKSKSEPETSKPDCPDD